MLLISYFNFETFLSSQLILNLIVNDSYLTANNEGTSCNNIEYLG